MEENMPQNIAIHETEPYQALAREILGTVMEEQLDLPEVIKALKMVFIAAMMERCEQLSQKVEAYQSEFKKVDFIIQSLRKA